MRWQAKRFDEFQRSFQPASEPTLTDFVYESRIYRIVCGARRWCWFRGLLGGYEAPEKKETYSAKCACDLAWVSGESGFESLHRQFFCVGITRIMFMKSVNPDFYFIRLSPLSSSLFSSLFQLRKSLSLSNQGHREIFARVDEESQVLPAITL